MSGEGPEVRRLVVGPVESNCWLVRRAGDEHAVVVDPGAEAERVEAALEAWEAELRAVLLTHAHMDHVGAVAPLVKRWDVPVHLHPADRPLYDRATEHARQFGLRIPDPPPPDHELADGQTVEAAGLAFDVRHAPGHSPGGVVLVCGRGAFVGDCVFRGSVGRVDLPGGDGARLRTSIEEEILTLPDEAVLWPGHGPETTVQRERRSNPFLTGAVRWGR